MDFLNNCLVYDKMDMDHINLFKKMTRFDQIFILERAILLRSYNVVPILLEIMKPLLHSIELSVDSQNNLLESPHWQYMNLFSPFFIEEKQLVKQFKWSLEDYDRIIWFISWMKKYGMVSIFNQIDIQRLIKQKLTSLQPKFIKLFVWNFFRNDFWENYINGRNDSIESQIIKDVLYSKKKYLINVIENTVQDLNIESYFHLIGIIKLIDK